MIAFSKKEFCFFLRTGCYEVYASGGGIVHSAGIGKRVIVYLFGGILVIAWGLYFFMPHGQTASVTMSTPYEHKQSVPLVTVTTSPDVMTVYVVGAVRHPGLYKLPLDARVSAALKVAGGPTNSADLYAINLAAIVEDGMQIVVPNVSQVASNGGTSALLTTGTVATNSLQSTDTKRSRHRNGKLQPGERIQLNQASLATLMEIPGIGKKKAENILTYKAIHGAFSSLMQLQSVQGIGPRLLAKILPYVTL